MNRSPAGSRWPRGHLGWAYSGLPEFEGRAASFLADGHVLGERQIFICDDPHAGRWPKDLLECGDLLVHSTAELYGESRVVDATAQGAVFQSILDEARALGYTGIRVVADNTSLTSTPERLEAWMCWEEEADMLIQRRPITGLCAFDRTRTAPATLKALMDVHPETLAA
ncbi:MEDS domain-containing protein [Sinomonas notoginsengisoli]|uniref:MEDS domain-containing protein n=1 Tax=Sinomonas notoginsengisoli TaxID=1457311 RepID=UPI001F241DD6|nr:MEDS domain-containing protein [Sinomonas notoginsengisoli]